MTIIARRCPIRRPWPLVLGATWPRWRLRTARIQAVSDRCAAITWGGAPAKLGWGLPMKAPWCRRTTSRMTTITTQAPTQAAAQGPVARRWRHIVVFAAGVSLAAGVALGATVVHDGGTSNAPVSHGQPASGTDTCRVHVPGPC
jgi:hypothetical protein